MSQDFSSKNDKASLIAKEMLPFALYAAIPLAITIFIAFTFGAVR